MVDLLNARNIYKFRSYISRLRSLVESVSKKSCHLVDRGAQSRGNDA